MSCTNLDRISSPVSSSKERTGGRLSAPPTDHSFRDNDNGVKRDPLLYIRAFTAGSIASSCCLIQLGINFLSYVNIVHVGCAGFNKTLGPIRPYTRTLTLAWLGWNWTTTFMPYSTQVPKKDGRLKNSDCCPRVCKRQLLLSTLMCLVLMFMPEFLEIVGDFNSRRELRAASKSSTSIEDREFVRVEYVVDNMGCEACVNAVEGIISRHKGVAVNKVTSFDFGEVDMYVDATLLTLGQKEIFERELDELLRVDGYELHEKGWTTKKMEMETKTQHTKAFL